jgi:hypothetical protein
MDTQVKVSQKNQASITAQFQVYDEVAANQIDAFNGFNLTYPLCCPRIDSI